MTGSASRASIGRRSRALGALLSGAASGSSPPGRVAPKDRSLVCLTAAALRDRDLGAWSRIHSGSSSRHIGVAGPRSGTGAATASTSTPYTCRACPPVRETRWCRSGSQSRPSVRGQCDFSKAWCLGTPGPWVRTKPPLPWSRVRTRRFGHQCLRTRHVRVGVKECRRSRPAQARRCRAEPARHLAHGRIGGTVGVSHRLSVHVRQHAVVVPRRGLLPHPVLWKQAGVPIGTPGRVLWVLRRPPENCAHTVGGPAVGARAASRAKRGSGHCARLQARDRRRRPVSRSPRRQARGAALPGDPVSRRPAEQASLQLPGPDSDRQQASQRAG